MKESTALAASRSFMLIQTAWASSDVPAKWIINASSKEKIIF